MSCELRVGESNPLFLSGLLGPDGEYVNDAVVTLTINDLDGFNPVTMSYVADSQGVYEYVLADDAGLIDGEQYEITIVAAWSKNGQDYEATTTTTYTARSTGKQYGPSVYATCEDLTSVFGNDNVDKWADLNNEEDAQFIRDRKNWALHLASRRIDELLYAGPYSVPFSLPYPVTLVDMTARLAGVILYEGRGIADSDDMDHKLASFKQEVHAWCSRVVNGQVRLRVSMNKATYPQVVRELTDG